MTADQFRKIALDLPESIEAAHMHHPDFRVAGRIFATLAYPNKASAVVKFTSDQQKRFMRSNPDVFAAVNGAWGRRGYTSVHLPAAKIDNVREALLTAWRNAAPKRLLAAADSKSDHGAE